MDIIEQTIKKFLKDFNLDESERVYLVAFSGGFDSMCLLNALKNVTSNRIVAIHLNHNWRGEESDNEEQNCKDFCKKIEVEFYSEKLPDNVDCNETDARNARYEFFEKCAKKFKSNIIFTAHNKNDNAETLIYRIAKGTGVAGLCSIAKNREIYYRPLLETERKDIEKYCKNNGLNPNNDSSNFDKIHKRNLIRSDIMPLLFEINTNITDSLNSLIQSAKEEEQIVEEYIIYIKNKILNDDKYNTKEFLNFSESLRMRLIYELVTPLVPQDYDRQRIKILLDFIENNSNSKSGKICSVTTGYKLYVCEKYFELVKENNNEKINIKINNIGEYKNGRINLNICKFDGSFCESDKLFGRTVYVDLSSVDFDFEFRTRQDGDIIQPFGMSGHQKLKKYLNSKKIPNHKKDELLFLAQKNEILWAVDLGLSDKIKVRTKPTHKIEVKINGN